MPLSLEQIASEILALPVPSRAFLAEKLLESLDHEEDFSVNAAWVLEVKKRCQEMDAGTVQEIPSEQVFSELRRELA